MSILIEIAQVCNKGNHGTLGTERDKVRSVCGLPYHRRLSQRSTSTVVLF